MKKLRVRVWGLPGEERIRVSPPILPPVKVRDDVVQPTISIPTPYPVPIFILEILL
jgi:hypothetical protein